MDDSSASLVNIQSVGTQGGSVPAGKFLYDAFLSYSTRADYRTARRLEAFLESFHKVPAPHGATLRPLQICRDGSDFRLARPRYNAPEAEQAEVWSTIERELSAARYLIVLCSPQAAASPWMQREIEWRLQSGEKDAILLAITGESEPERAPESCIPQLLIEAGLARRIWYDLRGLSGKKQGVRDVEDEMVRLAGDLLDWDSAKFGPLHAVWEREQLRLQRRNAVIAFVVGAALSVVACFAIWEALTAKEQTARARSNALTAAVGTMNDPLLGALVLSAAARDAKPEHGPQLALTLASRIAPIARMRAHAAAVEALAAGGKPALIASAGDGEIKLWRMDKNSDATRIVFGASTTSLVFDAAGKRLVATGADRFAVWKATGEPIGAPALRKGGYVRAGFLHDRDAVVALSDDGFATIRFPGADRPDVTIAPPETCRFVAIWPGDAEHPALIAADDLSLWRLDLDGASPRLVQQAARPHLREYFPEGLVNDVWFSDSGRRVLAIFAESVIVFDATGRFIARLRHPDLVKTAMFGADDQEILTSCSDGKARIFKEGDPQPREYDPGPRTWSSLGFSQSNLEVNVAPSMSRAIWTAAGNGFLTQSDDGTTRLWERSETAVWQELGGHIGADRVIALTVANGAGQKNVIVTGADDGTLRIWERPTRISPEFVSAADAVDRAGFNASGSSFTLMSRDGVAQLCETESVSCARVAGAGSKAKSFTFHPTDDSLLAIGYTDGKIQQVKWRQRAAEVLQDLPLAHAGAVRGVRFAQGGAALVSWSDDNSLLVHWPKTHSATALLPPSADKIWSVDVSRDGAKLVVGFESGKILLWTLGDDAVPLDVGASSGLRHNDTVFCVAFDALAKHVVSTSKDGTARVWKLENESQSKRFKGDEAGDKWLESCAFSRDGSAVYIASETGRVWKWLWSSEQSTLLRAVNDLAHVGSVSEIAVSPDGAHLATAGAIDGVVRIWRVDLAERPLELRAHRGTVTSAQFASDGAWLLTGGEDATARLWRWRWDDLLKLLRERSDATLFPDERMHWLGETEHDARNAYRDEERRHGRTGDIGRSFKIPF